MVHIDKADSQSKCQQRSELLRQSVKEIVCCCTLLVLRTNIAGNESEEWSSQYIFQFKQLERRSLKIIRASTGFKPMTSAPNVWLHSSVGRAWHRYSGGQFFFRLLLPNWLYWKIYCDDHSSLSSTTAVHIWITSYIHYIIAENVFWLARRIFNVSNFKLECEEFLPEVHSLSSCCILFFLISL